jgi:hypothetical protein
MLRSRKISRWQNDSHKQKEGKMNKYLLIAGILLILTGLGLIISPISNTTTYYASGRLLLNDTEWEQFKSDLYSQDKAYISKISYLDSGDIKIVEFHDLTVSQDFAYGTLTEHSHKTSPLIIILEFIFMISGSVLLEINFVRVS